MKSPLIKIALLGPESTGKSILCEALAKHYQTVWVPEYARKYIGSLNRKYTLEDVLHCAEMQMKKEEELAIQANRFLFCDTELINIKVWCTDVFKTVPAWIEQQLIVNPYDLHLLTYPDITFITDNVRENPHRRDFFFNWYKQELESYDFPYEIIKGTSEDRIKNAISSIEKYF